MAVEDDEMRLELLQDFGISDATFTDTSAGSSSTITALLKNEYSLEDVGGEVGVETSTPVAIVRSSDVNNVAQGDTIAISGTTYTIVEVQPDGEGMTNLRLRT
tara:strand:+ start:1048 stop:1356 length:309 start_codon:yes stop_codon:yes gene_type:complete